MKFTPKQFEALVWLKVNGGRARPAGLRLIAENGEETNTAAAIAFLNLCAKGAVAGSGGFLTITEYGERLLDGRP